MTRSVLMRLTGITGIAGIVCLGGCGDGTGPEEVVTYFPLELDNTWTYAPADPQYGDPFQWRVTSRVGDTVVVQRPAPGSHPGPVRLVDGEVGIDLLLGSGEAVPFYRFEPGGEWIHHDPWECDDGSTWIATAETEPVVTPAGSFSRTIRLERRTGASCADAGTMFEWWAPGVGLVRWEELNFYAGGPITFELVDRTSSGR